MPSARPRGVVYFHNENSRNTGLAIWIRITRPEFFCRIPWIPQADKFLQHSNHELQLRGYKTQNKFELEENERCLRYLKIKNASTEHEVPSRQHVRISIGISDPSSAQITDKGRSSGSMVDLVICESGRREKK